LKNKEALKKYLALYMSLAVFLSATTYLAGAEDLSDSGTDGESYSYEYTDGYDYYDSYDEFDNTSDPNHSEGEGEGEGEGDTEGTGDLEVDPNENPNIDPNEESEEEEEEEPEEEPEEEEEEEDSDDIEGNVLDLSNLDDLSSRFTIDGYMISVSGFEPVIIRGASAEHDYSIDVQEASQITIENGTTISGFGDGNVHLGALTVPQDAVIIGLGSGITITGKGNAAGLYSRGGLTLQGTFGVISGGNAAEGVGGIGGHGIHANGNLNISASINGVEGGAGASGGGGSGGDGILASGILNIAENADIGYINGGDTAYFNGSGGSGIHAVIGVVIDGTIGEVTGGAGGAHGGYGMFAENSDLVAFGSVGVINGGHGSQTDGYPIFVGTAGSFAVFNYTEDDIFDPSLTSPTPGHTIEFNYGEDYEQHIPYDAPLKIHISDGGKIPQFMVTTTNGRLITAWYKENTLLNVWDFDTDTADGSVLILYASKALQDIIFKREHVEEFFGNPSFINEAETVYEGDIIYELTSEVVAHGSEVALVNPETGAVSLRGIGTAVITAKILLDDDTEVFGSYTLEVKEPLTEYVFSIYATPPEAGDPPNDYIYCVGDFTAFSVKWENKGIVLAEDAHFEENIRYTLTVELMSTAPNGNGFRGVNTIGGGNLTRINGKEAAVLGNKDGHLTLSYRFPAL